MLCSHIRLSLATCHRFGMNKQVPSPVVRPCIHSTCRRHGARSHRQTLQHRSTSPDLVYTLHSHRQESRPRPHRPGKRCSPHHHPPHTCNSILLCMLIPMTERTQEDSIYLELQGKARMLSSPRRSCTFLAHMHHTGRHPAQCIRCCMNSWRSHCCHRLNANSPSTRCRWTRMPGPS